METKEDLIRAITRQLLRVLNKYSRIEELPVPVDKGVEITTKEIHTIQAIGENEHISITGVADHFGVTKSAASQIVRKLADKGFVKKEYAAYSNKELQLSLTKLGWLAFHAHEQFHGKDMARIMECLSAFSLSHIATLSVLLDVIENVMNERLAQK